MKTTEIVAKLWSLCHVLRDDGVTYNEYVTELTFLLFLKMLQETGRESRLPEEYRWKELARREGLEQLDHYKRLLLDLGNPKKVTDDLVQTIFTDAQTKLRKPTNLKALTTSIDQLDWYSAREEGLGNLYEGLLEKNAADKKSGAGQYFTPRPLIDCIVRLMKPRPGEVVQDPAAGTGGFLVAADRYIKEQTDDLYKLGEAAAFFQRHNAFTGAELVPDTHRLCLMNLLLHGIEGGVDLADTLSPDGERLSKADLILTNPPFGTKKGGGRPTRSDFSITADTSNKQLAFVEHIVRALKPGGRAALVVPDNVLFEDNTGRRLALGKKRTADVRLVRRPYLRVANVQRGWLNLSLIKEIEVTEQEASRLYLLPGDILMNEGGDRDKLGRGWIWQGEIANCIHQNHVFRVRLHNAKYPPKLISLYANEFGQNHFFDEGTQTTNLASISKARLSSLPLRLPPENEAREIVRRIEAAYAWIDRLAADATSARKLIDNLDQAILAKAFRGELMPQDPKP